LAYLLVDASGNAATKRSQKASKPSGNTGTAPIGVKSYERDYGFKELGTNEVDLANKIPDPEIEYRKVDARVDDIVEPQKRRTGENLYSTTQSFFLRNDVGISGRRTDAYWGMIDNVMLQLLNDPTLVVNIIIDSNSPFNARPATGPFMNRTIGDVVDLRGQRIINDLGTVGSRARFRRGQGGTGVVKRITIVVN